MPSLTWFREEGTAKPTLPHSEDDHESFHNAVLSLWISAGSTTQNDCRLQTQVESAASASGLLDHSLVSQPSHPPGVRML